MASIYDGMSGLFPNLNQAIPSMQQPGLYDVTGGFGSPWNQGIAPPPSDSTGQRPASLQYLLDEFRLNPQTRQDYALNTTPPPSDSTVPKFNNIEDLFDYFRSIQPEPKQFDGMGYEIPGSPRARNGDNLTPLLPRTGQRPTSLREMIDDLRLNPQTQQDQLFNTTPTTSTGLERAINVNNLAPTGPRTANQTPTYPIAPNTTLTPQDTLAPPLNPTYPTSPNTPTPTYPIAPQTNITPQSTLAPPLNPPGSNVVPTITGQGASTPPPGAIAPPVPPTGSTPPAGGTTPGAPNQFEQAWLDQNKGNWGADLMKYMSRGGGSNFKFDPMNIQWNNFSNGKQENITRDLGILQQDGGDALAKMIGGTLVDSPFATFGTQQRDKYIKMPNGQMIEASAFANQLQGASKSSNAFSSIADVIGLYQRENQSFDSKTNTDAVNLAMNGQLNPRNPPNWDPSKFAGGNPTYTPAGPVPGNPSNPGMGTSNPVEFQNKQINAINGQNGFPIFNYSQNQPGLPNNGGLYNPPGMTNTTPPATGGGTNTAGLPPAPTIPSSPAATAPTGVNLNSNYFLNQGTGQQGLGNQVGNSQAGSSGGGGGATVRSASGGGRVGAVGDSQPFAQAAPTTAWAGNLPNGGKSLGK